MADARPARAGRVTIVVAQLLLMVAAVALWVASRLPWVVVRSFDGLGQPKQATLSGGTWSSALLPLALLMLATAVAALAVRGWPLRVLAGLLAMASLAVGYLGVSLWVIPDVAVRGADLAHIPVMFLVGSERRYWGAGIAVAAAVCTLAAAVLLMRSGSLARESATKYAAPATRRSNARRDDAGGAMLEGSEMPENSDMSERMIWDALDEGRDPTDRARESDTEGR
ncbi:TIGR02234 family membrane protein [Mycobacterium terramassiliense]|uniref:Membrane protein n=1 Tax=Mycobacterium terramassiliense TaxID=1841859 RepID=A0A2U3N780_9MYCO|nr:TIGR02234 family membrane protein [Mycobacterium terramassiliense]SPM27310.1 membrane protein [Mycobacterium terramassiliense]